MSLLYYRRPDYTNPPISPLNASDCRLYTERAKNSGHTIPSGFSFEEIINDQPLPPCSLSDFMDYLVYIEHCAENLQFYLWFKDYEKRFNALPDRQRNLSPEWIEPTREVPDLTRGSSTRKEGKHEHKRSTSKQMMSETKRDMNAVNFSFEDDKDGQNVKPDSMSYILDVSRTMPVTAEAHTQAGLKWQSFTIQPFRSECDAILRHYMAFNSTRELNLSHRDRGLVFHASQHTTHPSAFAPAVAVVEATLRGQAHPNFVRWSICNGNKARIVFSKGFALQAIFMGFVVAILLILSHRSRWWRLWCFVFWLEGLGCYIASYRGLCVLLFVLGHARDLRPWEQDDPSATSSVTELGRASHLSTVNINRTSQSSASGDGTTGLNGKTGAWMDEDSKTEIAESLPETSTTFLPPRLNPFGERNSGWEFEAWVAREKKKALLFKTFPKTTWTKYDALRILQNKIVLGSHLWASIVVIPLTVITVWIPPQNLIGR